MKPLPMPRHLDDPMMVLMWSADELMPAVTLLLVGVGIDQKLICLVLAVVATKAFRKIKEGRPDGFMFHWCYWVGVLNGKGKTMPNPHIREYLI